MAIAEPVEQIDVMILKSEDGRVVFRVTPDGELIFGPDFGAADAAKHFVQFVSKIMDERDQHVLRDYTELRKTILGYLKDRGEIRRLAEKQRTFSLTIPTLQDQSKMLLDLHRMIEKKCG